MSNKIVAETRPLANRQGENTDECIITTRQCAGCGMMLDGSQQGEVFPMVSASKGVSHGTCDTCRAEQWAFFLADRASRSINYA